MLPFIHYFIILITKLAYLGSNLLFFNFSYSVVLVRNFNFSFGYSTKSISNIGIIFLIVPKVLCIYIGFNIF